MAGVRTTSTKAVSYAPQVEKIPLLPGNNFHDDPINRANLRKSHQLGMNTLQPEFVPPTEYSATKHPSDAAPRKQPTREEMAEKWAGESLQYRFSGYFREAVHESPDEKERIRRCCITFYSEDGTVMIREARVENSGAANGVHGGGSVLIRRHRIYEADGTAVDLDDLQVGEEFECYGKVFKILDCDARTRQQLTKQGWVVPDPIPFPFEEDQQFQLNKKRMKMEGVRQMRTDDMDVKRQMEFQLSGRCSKVHPDQAKAAKQFLAAGNGKSHLTFRLLWDDNSGVRREMRAMALRYYLEDDTMEIAENRVVNSGRDSAVKFMCRQRIPKKGAKNPDINIGEVQHGTFGVLLRRDFITWDMLNVGDTITVHNKEFLIFDADAHTRQWFLDKGKPLNDPVDISEQLKVGQEAEVKHYPPPHDGYGDEEDSLGNWRSLMLKAPKKDYEKLLRDSHKVLRFKASLYGTKAAEDEGREFVINYFIATREVQVVENSVRNSGIIATTMLAKRKLYRECPRTGQKMVMEESEFRPGKVVNVLGRQFLLEEVDARSQKIIDGVEDMPTPEKVKQVICGLRDLLNQKYQKCTEAFRALSTKGHVSTADIEEFLRRNNQPVRRGEAKTVLKYFDTKGKGQLDFQDFIVLMEYKNSKNMDESSSRAQAIKLDHVLGDEEDDHDEADKRLKSAALKRSVLRALRDRLEQRCCRQQEIYRIMAGRKASSLLDREEFAYGLKHVLHMNLKPEEEAAVTEGMFPDGKQEITFPEFSSFLEACGEFLPES